MFQRLFGTPKRSEMAPVNTWFTVISGNILTRDGKLVAFSTTVPTVFSSGDYSHHNDHANIAVEETVLFALELAQEKFPGCQWQNPHGLVVREANDRETAWALLNGVNERCGG